MIVFSRVKTIYLNLLKFKITQRNVGEVCAKIGQGEQKYASDKKSWTDRRSDEQTDRYVYSQESQIPLKEQGDGQKV